MKDKQLLDIGGFNFRYFFRYLVISYLFIFVFFYNREFYYDQGIVLIALATFGIVGAIFILAIKTKQRIYLLIFPSIGLTWIYYQRPFLSTEEIYHPYRIIPEEYLMDMVLFTGLGLIGIIIGYFYFFKTGVKALSSTSYKVENSVLIKVIRIFIVIALLNRIIQFAIPILYSLTGQLLLIFNYAASIVIALLVLYYIRGGRSVFLLSFGILFGLLELYLRISETLFTNVLTLFGGGILIYILESRKIPYLLIIAFYILLYPIYLTRMDYRVDPFRSNKLGLIETIIEGKELFVKSFSDLSFNDYFPMFNNDQDFNAAESDRLEQISYLGQIVYRHEIEGQKYYYGKTFWWLPLVPIPRIIFPNKPVNLLATRMAEDYGVKGSSGGAMNFPLFVEYFINFGFIGIFIMGIFQGAFYKWVFQKVGYGIGDLNLVILLTMILQLVKIEANITMVFGQIIQILIFWWVIIKVFNIGLIKKV